MSRKTDSFGGRNFELYKEWPAEDCVVLALEGFGFEATKNKVTVQIPAALWEVLRTYPGCVTELAPLDDRELLVRAQQIVDGHIAEWKSLPAKRRKHELWNFYLRDAGKPRIRQLRSELERLLEERASQRAMLRRIAAYKKETSRDAGERRLDAQRKRWKKDEPRIKRKEAASIRAYEERQARHRVIVERLLHTASGSGTEPLTHGQGLNEAALSSCR